MDECDEALRMRDAFLADCLARRTVVAIPPRVDGRCPYCRRPVPTARLASGCGTCLQCQMKIESGDLKP